jgi:hypothetical protein
MNSEEPTSLHPIPATNTDEWRRAHNILQGLLFERTQACHFIEAAEKLLKDAGAFVTPRPGDLRFVVILAGLQHLIDEKRRLRRLNTGVLMLVTFSGIALSHLVEALLNRLLGVP